MIEIYVHNIQTDAVDGPVEVEEIPESGEYINLSGEELYVLGHRVVHEPVEEESDALEKKVYVDVTE